MSWHYLPEPAGDHLRQSGSWDSEPSATSNGMNTGSKSSKPESEMGCLTMLPSGETSGHSTGDPGVDAWILSLRASPASPSRSLGSRKLRMTSEISGLTPFASLEKCDQNGAYWKTSQACFPDLTGTLDRYFGTWPRAGMMQAGRCYRLPRWERRIREIGSGSWPTPRAQERCQHNSKDQGVSLSKAVLTFPTPTAESCGSNQGGGAGRVGRVRPSLETMARKALWPTPTVHGNYNRADLSRKSGNGLVTAVLRWLPPRAATKGDWTTIEQQRLSGQQRAKMRERGQELPRGGGQLNPDWVEWLMGWPIEWTDLGPLATDRFRKWLKSFGGC